MAEADGAEKKALEAKVTALEQGIEAKREQTPLGIDEGQVNAHLGSVEALSGLNTSIQSLADQQKSFELGLRQLDRELADAQRGVARAFEAKTDAAVSLEAAKLQSEQQLQQAADAVADAQRTLDSAGNQAQSSVQKLRDDIDSNEIRAPFPGLVTVVSGKEGAPAQGPVVTIADDSTLVIKTSVRENEVPKLKIGNPVRFTTRATGDAEFTGEVSFISPVSEKIGQAAAADAKGPSTGGTSAEPPMFPIEITVTGNTEGLKIGGSAKAEITLDKVENTLVVPRGAVIDGPTSKEVLRIGDNNVIERVKVEVGTENDFSVAVTGGDLKSGDRIISNASSRRDMVGQSVDINDSPMPGGDGPQSGTGDEEDSDSAGNKVEKEGE
nr:HlyD family efflux transporter periplasmic adaptor subunit [Corynebacterium mendelii]